MSDPRRSGEFDLIARLFAPLAAGEPGAFGLTDDAAVLAIPPDQRLVITTDTMVAGVHFLPDDPPDLIARKLMRVNLSDLAAMGATPMGYTLNTALPKTVDDLWMEQFAKGLKDDQERFGFTLVGGDTVAIPGPLTLTLTALGRVGTGQEIRRSGARARDILYVSGCIGDAALGLMILQKRLPGLSAEDERALICRYHLPEPRVGLGPELCGLAHAALDVSDGLIADLGHICETSGRGAVVRGGDVPLSPAARRVIASGRVSLETLITGGDDYELLFCAPPSASAALQAISRRSGVAITAIGEITDDPHIRVLDPDGAEICLNRAGYTHF